MPFKMYKIIFFPAKKIVKKVCATLPKFPDPLPEHTLIFFILPKVYDDWCLSEDYKDSVLKA